MDILYEIVGLVVVSSPPMALAAVLFDAFVPTPPINSTKLSHRVVRVIKKATGPVARRIGLRRN